MNILYLWIGFRPNFMLINGKKSAYVPIGHGD